MTGWDNIAVGYLALNSNTTGSYNCAVGSGALQNNTAGNNTAVGYCALVGNTSGSYNTCIGYGTGNGSGGGSTYSTAIGANATITDSHQIMMGTSNEAVVVPGATYTCGGTILFGNPINTSITYTGTGGTPGPYNNGSFASITFPVCVTPTIASTGILTLTLMLSGRIV